MSLFDSNGEDIWASGAFSFESPLKDLLDSGNYTLEQLLREDELLQELKGLHPTLIAFFSRPEICKKLVQYLSTSPKKKKLLTEEDGEDKNFILVRYPYMACEVICCEISGIVDTLVDTNLEEEEKIDEMEEMDSMASNDGSFLEEANGGVGGGKRSLLDLLFSVLDLKSGEMDDRLAGYFEKVLTVLFRRRPATLSSYINSRGTPLLQRFINHLSSHSITQILLRLLLPDTEPPPGSFTFPPPLMDNDSSTSSSDQWKCSWSTQPQSIHLLLSKLTCPGHTEEVVDSARHASEILIQLIQNSHPNKGILLPSLLRKDFLEQIVKRGCLLDDEGEWEPYENSMTCCLGVLESIILQLGGYGNLPTREEDEERSSDHHPENGEGAKEGTMTVQKNDEQLHPPPPPPPPPQRRHRSCPEALVQLLPMLLSNLSKLLTHPCTNNWAIPFSSFGNQQLPEQHLQPQLGYSRLKIIRLIESLIFLSSSEVDDILCQSEILEICINLFLNFEWSSMLHQSVANMIVHVLEAGPERYNLQRHLLQNCNLLDKIINAFERKSEWRLGYSGHLIIISQAIDHVSSFGEEQMISDEERAVKDVDLEAGRITTITSTSLKHDENPPPISASVVSKEDKEEIIDNGVQKEDGTIPVEDVAVSIVDKEQGDTITNSSSNENDVKDTIQRKDDDNVDAVIVTTDAISSKKEEEEEEDDVITANEISTNDTNLAQGVFLATNLAREEELAMNDDVASPLTIERITEKEEQKEEEEEMNDDLYDNMVLTRTLSKDFEQTEEEEKEQTPPLPPPPPPPRNEKDQTDDTPEAPTSPQHPKHPKPSLVQVIHSHPTWSIFFTQTLTPILQIQSTPLGNTPPPQPHSDELSMTETDLDIAASMMDSLTTKDEGISMSFGSKIDFPSSSNTTTDRGDYIYDDPLSRGVDEEDEEEVVGGHEGGDEEEEDDDGHHVPVMDLFAGNFDDKPSSSSMIDITPPVESIVAQVEREAKQVLEEEDEVAGGGGKRGAAAGAGDQWANFEGDLFGAAAGECCFEADFSNFETTRMEDEDEGAVNELMNGKGGVGVIDQQQQQQQSVVEEDDPFGDIASRRHNIEELF